MKIFLTGHKGYLGQEFIKKYGNKYDIVGFDIIDGDDINDLENMKEKMQGCEYVVHLAAIPKPEEEKSIDDYFKTNVKGTHNVLKAASVLKIHRFIYGSSTTVYGIEKGIPFQKPITEEHPIVSQYISSEELSCREADLSYHVSKVMAEQLVAWYGLNKKMQTVSLRFGPINTVFLDTSVSVNNATQAIDLSLQCKKELWYEAFSIVDEIDHIDISKAKKILSYKPENPHYKKNKQTKNESIQTSPHKKF